MVLNPGDLFDFIWVNNKCRVYVFPCEDYIVKLMLCELVTGLSVVQNAADYLQIISLQIVNPQFKISSSNSSAPHPDKMRFHLQLLRNVCVVGAACVCPTAWECDLLKCSLLKEHFILRVEQ